LTARFHSRIAFAAAAALTGAAFLLPGEPAASTATTAAAAPPARPAPAAAVSPAVTQAHATAAGAVRRGDRSAAERALAPLLASPGVAAERARVVLGLLDWNGKRCAPAKARLAEGPAPADLEDWRLYALADCLASDPASAVEARAAYEAILSVSPPSPLTEIALFALAELAWTQNDAALALAWIERGRARGLAPAEMARLDTLAWSIGRALGDVEVETLAAKRLLVLAPLEASRLEVAAPLAARGQDWRTLLSVDELLDRAGALLDVQVPQGALTTLEAIPTTSRGNAWRAVQARALVASQRGLEALVVLDGAARAAGDEAARLELLRAAAANEAATARRGRPVPAQLELDRLGSLELASLARAADVARSPEIQRRALAELFAELESEERFEEAIVALRRLVALDPDSTLGARALWQRGFREYRGGNYSGAIGYWSELTTLFPRLSYSRSAAYWSARAHQALGERDRARRGYLDLSRSGTRDFYTRQAERQLAAISGGAPGAPPNDAAPPAAETEREAWPVDPALARARELSDLGLDAIAAIELEQLAPDADERAVDALRGLLLSRQGDPRASLRELRKAFPRLGTAWQASLPREALELYYPRPFDDRVRRSALAQGLPGSLVFGIVHQESGFDPSAKSRSGARGLMQIMPATGRDLAKRLSLPYTADRLFDPDYSLHLGTTYFRQLLGQFDGNVELALAGYNGGPGRIGRLWRAHGPDRGVDLFLEELALEESRNYVKRILVLAESYRSLYSDLS
jgi:soluble lytic murein transglycosylase-like protein